MRDTVASSCDQRFKSFAERMKNAGMDGLVIEQFRRNYYQLLAGGVGFLSRHEIDPLVEAPDLEGLGDYYPAGISALDKAVVIKLNGGLGTGMGMERAKSLLEVKNNLSFLDIIARQVLHVRRAYNCRLPLILMNSAGTRKESCELLRRYPELTGSIPPDFLQHSIPKIEPGSLAPVSWPAHPAMEWCPPGHGDIYCALVTPGMLALLIAEGFEYAFVSNADNLGAVVDVGYWVIALP